MLPRWPRLRGAGRPRRLQPRQRPARRPGPRLRDRRFRRLSPHGAGGRLRRRPRLAPARAAGRGRLPRRADRDRRLCVARPVRAGGARGARRPRRCAAGDDRRDQRVARRALSRRTREYIQAWDAESWALLETFDALGADEVSYRLGAARPAVATGELAAAARSRPRPALTALTYDRPVHVVRGEGVWLFEADGTRLLDAYNNVPVVGHCHPRVTEAVVRQTRRLNTHARYLVRAAGRARRAARRLDAGRARGSTRVLLVNSGSEANELAWRLALAATGQQRRGRDATRVPRRHGRDRRPLARGVAGGHRPGARRDRRAAGGGAGGGDRAARGARARARGDVPRHRVHERRRARPRPRRAPGRGRADARGAAASSSRTRCRRDTAASAAGSGRSRATGSRRTRSRSASRWGTATPSLPWSRARELVERLASRDERLQHLRREPGGGPGRPRRARRSRGRGSRRARRPRRCCATGVSRGASQPASWRCAVPACSRRRARIGGARRGCGQRECVSAVS